MVGRYVIQSSAHAKFLPSGSNGLSDAVGEQYNDLAGFQQDLVLSGEFAVGKKPQRGSIALQNVDHESCCIV